VLIIVNITTPSVSWLLLNNKFAYAAATSASVRVNGRALYATAVSARSTTNKLTTAAAATAAMTVSSAPPPAKALPSLTRSLSLIITKIKEGNNNKNNLTKGHPASPFLLDTNRRYGSSKSKSITSSAFENAVHNTVRINGKEMRGDVAFQSLQYRQS
jgi:hypothetical protein